MLERDRVGTRKIASELSVSVETVYKVLDAHSVSLRASLLGYESTIMVRGVDYEPTFFTKK